MNVEWLKMYGHHSVSIIVLNVRPAESAWHSGCTAGYLPVCIRYAGEGEWGEREEKGGMKQRTQEQSKQFFSRRL